MDKRVILAIALSLLIILTWSALMSKFYPTENKRVIAETQPSTADTILPAPAPQNIPDEQKPSEPQAVITLPLESWVITFIEPLAAIKEATFSAYLSYSFPLKYGFLSADKNLIFKKETNLSNNNKLVFVSEDKDKRIKKTFLFSKSNYAMELTIEIENLSDKPININLPLVIGVLDFKRDPIQARYQDVVVALQDKTLHRNGRKDESFASVKFLGLRDRYICAIVEPQSEGWAGFIKKIDNRESEVGLRNNASSLMPGQTKKDRFLIYLGPQELRHINLVQPAWTAVLHYGTFDFIAQFLLQILEKLHAIVHNWGWVIIILSIGIYFVLFPLTLKQMRSMKHMQALQPEIEELRKLYKDNPQKLNKEIMELYRRNRINPFAGCLPLILQMPIFIALYQVLIRSVSLKGADFLWIKDLSEPDRLFILPVSLPILGNEVNILPILMAIGMFVQQRLSSGAATSGSAEQQKMMMFLLPVMFGFIFYHMPAGLVLYWFTNSLFMLIYQIRISRIK